MEIKYYNLGDVDNEQFKYAVIGAIHKGKWIFVRHKERQTWEMPAGHREESEDIDFTASRELFEETGAIKYDIEPICDYSVTIGEVTEFSRLFHAKVYEIGILPDSEICEIRYFKEMPPDITYAEIQPHLYKRVLDHLIEEFLSYLKNDKNRNINMMNFIKSYPVHSFDRVGDSFLIRGRSDEDWVYISSNSFDEFKALIQGLDKEDKCFAILEDWMLPYIVKDMTIRSQLTSMKLVYDNGMSLPERKADVRELALSDAPYIYENSKYKEYTSIEYIKERISNGIGLGIYDDNKLVAWAITHDDGAIGFLNVLEEYRGKGYGIDVTGAMVEKLLERDEVPFVHIEEHNIKSLNLAMKIGFKPDRRIHWIKLN